MLINKQCKVCIVRPSADHLSRMAHYLPYRSKVLENIGKELLINQKVAINTITSAFFADSYDRKFERNVSAIVSTIKSTSLFTMTDSNRGLTNPSSGQRAEKKQEHDLLNFRRIGEEEFLARVSFFVLKRPSVQAPNRRRQLQTFSNRGALKSRQISQLERDKQLVLTSMKKKMQHSRKTGNPICTPDEQQLQLPLALCSSDGNPLTGQKSYTTKSLESRYKAASPPVFNTELPTGWIPECTLIEGMFLINTTPLGSHKTLEDYANFLLKRHAVPHFKKGSTEVHILFDTPGCLDNSPKQFEQRRRDSSTKAPPCCITLQGSTKVSSKKWRETVLACRTCKRSLKSNLLADISLTTSYLTFCLISLSLLQAVLMGSSSTLPGLLAVMIHANLIQPFPAMRMKVTRGYGCMQVKPLATGFSWCHQTQTYTTSKKYMFK